VDDALGVGLLQPFRDLPGDLQRLADLERPVGQHRRERLAGDEFEDQIAMAVALLEAVDGRDVRMVQRAEDARLGLA
jgi:hypothetical protein